MAPRKDRIQTRTDALQPEPFRPAASPAGAVSTPQARLVDTFVQPASTLNRNAGSGLSQLASALQGIAPSLGRFAAFKQDQQNTQDLKSGTEFALKLQQEGKSYKQAIEQGLIDPHQSKFYVKGVKEQMGAAMAGQFDDKLNEALATNEDLKVSTDPAAFDKFTAAFRKQWEAENIGAPKDDQDFTFGYAMRAQQHIEQRRADFINQIGPKLKQQSIAAHFSDTVKLATDETGRVPVDELAASFNQKNADLIAQGRSPELVYNTTVRAIRQAALRALEDPTNRDKARGILDLMTKITGKDGVALNDATDEGRESYIQTLATITDQRNKMALSDREAKKLADEKRMDTTYAAALKFAYENPTASLKPFVDQVADIRGAADEINAIRNTVAGTTKYDDDAVVKDIWSDIWLDSSKVSARRIIREQAKGTITLATANHLLSQLDEKQARERQTSAAERTADAASRREYRDLVSDPLFTRVLSEQQKQFVGTNGILAGASADASKQASAQLQEAWIRWRDGKGKDAGPVEMTQWLEANSTAIVKMNRMGLIGFDQKGEPVVKPSKPKEKVPELSTTDIEVLRKLKNGEQVDVPPALQRRLDGLGSQDAAVKFINEQIALHKPQTPKATAAPKKPAFTADTTGLPRVKADSAHNDLVTRVKHAVDHDYPLEVLLRQVDPSERVAAMNEYFRQHNK